MRMPNNSYLNSLNQTQWSTECHLSAFNYSTQSMT